ncbi:MAG: F0F1 ATP synthase subunit delta [Hyphomicrobiaceae bacterium]
MATDDVMMASAAGRYAAALFDLANEENQVAQVEGDLGTFQSLLDMSDDLTGMVKSPLYSSEEQSAAIETLADKAGIGGLTKHFLLLVTKKRRLPIVRDIIKAFRALLAQSRGEVTAEVTSAVALNEAQVNELKETLKASVGKDVNLDTRIDPALLGGLVVKIGSRMVDTSLRTKLSKLRLSLKEAG